MSSVCIPLLQDKYPDKILAALDSRTATIHKDTVQKRLYALSPDEYDIRVTKPRERDTVPLRAFDEELELFVHIEQDVVYYMPGSTRYYHTYATNVAGNGTTLETVAEMADAALKQSLSDQGEMKDDEVRIFWMENLRSLDIATLVHVTVVRMKREYRIVADFGFPHFMPYTTLLSLCIPIESESAAPIVLPPPRS